jgi:1-acylglycerone phosphate reductase
VEAYSETQRLELAPYKVKVLVVIAGGVKTPIHETTPRPALREGALWSPTEDENLHKIDNGRSATFPPPEDFAEGVISDALGGKTGRTYRGKYSSTMNYVQGIMPNWLLVR